MAPVIQPLYPSKQQLFFFKGCKQRVKSSVFLASIVCLFLLFLYRGVIMSECSTKIGGKQDVKTGKTFKDAHMSYKRKT